MRGIVVGSDNAAAGRLIPPDRTTEPPRFALPEVRFALLVSGRYDVVVHVAVRDTQHLKDLALDHFTSRPAVTRIETSIIFDARRRHALPDFHSGG